MAAAVPLMLETQIVPWLVGEQARLPFLIALIGIFGGLQTFRPYRTVRRPGAACGLSIVEDEQLIPILATEYLEGVGFTVDTAGSATEAMNKLALVRGGADAAVIDLGLPDRPGDALFREIRALYSSLPIVLATGQNAADLRSSFLSAPRVAFVSKPYTEVDLLAALKPKRMYAWDSIRGRC